MKKVSIVLAALLFISTHFSGCSKTDAFEITMPYASYQYENGAWTIEELTSHLQELGFSDIETEEYTPTGYEDDEIYRIVIDNARFGFDIHETFNSDAEVKIGYYVLEPNLTTVTCKELDYIFSAPPNEMDKAQILSAFVKEYEGKYMEFDATITESFSDVKDTQYFIALSAGDYASDKNVLFWINGTSFSGLGITNDYFDEYVKVGEKVHVIAQISSYRIGDECIEIKPVYFRVY